tara:strand:+ start:1130 stop:2284 length:1155 start_codon:yes stop_codon:yes gene_type:complete
MSNYKNLAKKIISEIQLAYVVRYLDPKNGKRFAVPFKTEPDAKQKRDQLQRDGAKQLSITKDYLKGKFKESVDKDGAYAIGMAKAKDMYNDEKPVDKKTITKAHDIAKAILRKEEYITEEQLIEQDKQELQEFSKAQLDILARQFADLKGKTISIDRANQLRKIFDKIPNHFLNDLRKKHIPFLSGLALSRMIQKGIPVRENIDTDYLKSKLNTAQINNIKNTWKMKKATDVTPAVKDMIKKMDIPTQLAIKHAGINHLSKLIEQSCECKCGQSPCKSCGKDHHNVKEDASKMAQAMATGTQKKIADLSTRIKDTETRGRDIDLGDKTKIAINKADVTHMKLKLADLKDKLRSDRQKRAMAAQNEPETDSTGKPNKKKEITENE